LTLPDLAERLDVEVSVVRGMLAERRLLGARRGGVFAVPAAFLVPGHLANPASPGNPDTSPAWAVLTSLAGTFTVLADVGYSDDEAIEWLFTHDEDLDATPLDALRAGRKSAVRRRAQLDL
jgi:hypothetical protein